jgi:hypothetical protein
MYLLYVDESGDPGLIESPTRYFVLTGLVVHELRWSGYLESLILFRQRLKERFGLKLREEFHAASFITRPGELVRIPRNDRLTMIRSFTDLLANLGDISIINVIVDKQGKRADYDVFQSAWSVLLQRFENTLSHHNFPGPANPDEKGIILCDHTDDKKLLQLLRRRRHYNPVPNRMGFGTGYRNLPLQYIVEDPCFRDSRHSYFIQAVDLAAFVLYQKMSPSSYMKKKSAHNYFNRLHPVLCRWASTTDPEGIVRL